MKSSIVISALFMVLAIAGCRKNDNPRVPDLEKVPLPLLTLDSNSVLDIPGTGSEAFTATFAVDVYFKNGEQPKQFDVVVIKNGDKANPKTIQANISTFPTTVTITGQQLADLFGAPIALGDVFLVGTDVTTLAGKKYPAFPEGGVTYAPGIATQPGANTQLRFAAPCVFVPADFTEGDYTVVVDEWADYGEGDKVSVTKISDVKYSFKYLASAAQPIIMNVDPATNAITVPKVTYGNYGGTSVDAEGSGTVDACNIGFTVKLHHTGTAGGDFGEYTITLVK